jgi:hypothetical protein
MSDANTTTTTAPGADATTTTMPPLDGNATTTVAPPPPPYNETVWDWFTQNNYERLIIIACVVGFILIVLVVIVTVKLATSRPPRKLVGVTWIDEYGERHHEMPPVDDVDAASNGSGDAKGAAVPSAAASRAPSAPQTARGGKSEDHQSGAPAVEGMVAAAPNSSSRRASVQPGASGQHSKHGSRRPSPPQPDDPPARPGAAPEAAPPRSAAQSARSSRRASVVAPGEEDAAPPVGLDETVRPHTGGGGGGGVEL